MTSNPVEALVAIELLNVVGSSEEASCRTPKLFAVLRISIFCPLAIFPVPSKTRVPPGLMNREPVPI